jgi:hypothetical protein
VDANEGPIGAAIQETEPALDSGGRSRVIAHSHPDGYHFYSPNIELLRSISNETNGGFQPRAEDKFEASSETTALPHHYGHH